jgi:glyoxylase-like metal-dependent hydrolase (beta-lactamase superfamily II)
MKMHILSGGRLRMRKSVYLPSADRSETIELPVNCVLLRHSQGNVLFDTGCHPSTVDDAEARWGTMAKAMTPIGRPEDNVVSELAKLNLAPTDIDVVVNSHFHSDHCGCNEFFKRATVICHRRELEAAQAADAVQKGYLPVDWQQPMPIETVESQRRRPHRPAAFAWPHGRHPWRAGGNRAQRRVPVGVRRGAAARES